jgi:hypothetical protein
MSSRFSPWDIWPILVFDPLSGGFREVSRVIKPGDSDRDWRAVRASNAGVALRLRPLDVDAFGCYVKQILIQSTRGGSYAPQGSREAL